MAFTANQIQYRNEFIRAFELRKSLLTDCVTKEMVIKGSQAVFLVSGTDSLYAVTRGANGKIPTRSTDNNQKTATLAEYHAKFGNTEFDMFTTQGDQRFLLMDNAASVLNRTIDKIIFEALETSTVVQNATSEQATIDLIAAAYATLGNAVATGGKVTCILSPQSWRYLQQAKEFSSVDWSKNKPFDRGELAENEPLNFQWGGIHFIVHPLVPGKNTATEKIFMFNRAAVGLAIDAKNIQLFQGLNEEEGLYYARASVNMASVLLQDSGVVTIRHKGA